MTIRFVISLIFALIVAMFAIQNAASVTIKFLFAEFTISQALIILISATIGAIIVLILGTIKQFRLNKEISKLTKNVNNLEQENVKLKEQVEQINYNKVTDNSTIVEEVNTDDNDPKLNQ